MLAGRLVRIVRDILQEYEEGHLIQLLNQAIALCNERAGLAPADYGNRARQLREHAQNILNTSRIDRYPTEAREFVVSSQYAIALPERIAPVIINGLPDDKGTAISSNELSIYLNTANSMYSELNAMNVAFGRFSIEEIVVPPKAISLDLMTPRSSFSNDAVEYINTIRPFLSVMAYFGEIASGSRASPNLVYLSTTEPVSGLALIALAAWGVLKFYKLVLEVAEKQINLLKTIQTIREAGVGQEEVLKIEDHIKAVIEKSIEETVASAVGTIPHQVKPDRLMEIRVAIAKETPVIIEAVAGGARLSITLESTDNLSLLEEGPDGISIEQVHQQLEEQKKLEQKVAAVAAPFGSPVSGLLSNQRPTELE